MQDLSKVIKDRIKNYDNIIRETETVNSFITIMEKMAKP